jgi:hypothetical protein
MLIVKFWYEVEHLMSRIGPGSHIAKSFQCKSTISHDGANLGTVGRTAQVEIRQELHESSNAIIGPIGVNLMPSPMDNN